MAKTKLIVIKPSLGFVGISDTTINRLVYFRLAIETFSAVHNQRVWLGRLCL